MPSPDAAVSRDAVMLPARAGAISLIFDYAFTMIACYASFDYAARALRELFTRSRYVLPLRIAA